MPHWVSKAIEAVGAFVCVGLILLGVSLIADSAGVNCDVPRERSVTNDCAIYVSRTPSFYRGCVFVSLGAAFFWVRRQK